MYFRLDDQELVQEPEAIDIIPPSSQVFTTSGGRRIVLQEGIGSTLNVAFGKDGVLQELVEDLNRKRANVGVHLISFEDAFCRRIVHINGNLPPASLTSIGYESSGRLAYADLSLTIPQVELPSLLTILELNYPGTLTTTGDGKVKLEAAAPGRILFVDGHIGTLGTGGGQTKIQVSNGLTDYLSTRGDFIIASATNLMENQVLASNPDFYRGDILELDVDEIPGNSDSANLSVYLWCLLFR